MAPRLEPLVTAIQVATRSTYQPIAPFLYPFLTSQQRCASILSSLSDVKSAYNKRIRRGRGPASGKGKTSGRGHKGQGQRSKVPYNFNGGQTSAERMAGERGFENFFSVDMAPVNLNRIQAWIDQGRIDPSKPITLFELNKTGCVHRVKDGIKLLAGGKDELRSKIKIVVSRASAEAIKAVEALNGEVVTRFYSAFAIKKIRRGQMSPVHSLQSRLESAEGFQELQQRDYQYRLPDPARRKDIEYYRDHSHRGYLSYTVGAGESPSLFLQRPREPTKVVAAAESDLEPSSIDTATSTHRTPTKAEEKLW